MSAVPAVMDLPKAASADADAADAAVDRALGVPTRAGIYRRLRTAGEPATAREVAGMFGLHPNVARSHLDVLADAGLVVTSRRKNPAGGRPAKIYVAREQSDGRGPVAVPQGSQLGVSVLVGALAKAGVEPNVVEEVAREQGRRLVQAAAGRADNRDFEAAALVAVEALRQAFPEVRMLVEADGSVRVEGLEVGLRMVGEVDGRIGDATATGLLCGAMRAAGARADVTSLDGRVIARPSGAAADLPAPSARVDARGQTYQSGVVATMRAIVPLEPGALVEVLTDTQGAPAAFARWADRAGHDVVDVARVRDLKGVEAVRLVLRKAAS